MWNDQGRSRWGPLKGEVEMAQKDAARSEALDRELSRGGIYSEGVRRCEVCRQQLPAGATVETCKRCRKRLFMRDARRLALTPEQRERKNEQARLKRLRQADKEGNERRKASLAERQAKRGDAARARLRAKGIEVGP